MTTTRKRPPTPTQIGNRLDNLDAAIDTILDRLEALGRTASQQEVLLRVAYEPPMAMNLVGEGPVRRGQHFVGHMHEPENPGPVDACSPVAAAPDHPSESRMSIDDGLSREWTVLWRRHSGDGAIWGADVFAPTAREAVEAAQYLDSSHNVITASRRRNSSTDIEARQFHLVAVHEKLSLT